MEDSQNPGCPEQQEASVKVKDGQKLRSTVSEVKTEAPI